jgi:5-formyltetrahydrofolate cyclo-ligase
MLKKFIRKEYLVRRLEITDEELQRQSDQMVRNFKTFDLTSLDYLLSYYPLHERKEFDVALCEKLVLERNPESKIAWPKLCADGASMEAHRLSDHSFFVKNKYNILEPVGGSAVDAELFDMIFVPLLAFDSKGYRVGYGKGYYDRYLVKCRPDAIKMSFSFFDAIERIDDINEFDVPLNYCITPMRIYEF